MGITITISRNFKEFKNIIFYTGCINFPFWQDNIKALAKGYKGYSFKTTETEAVIFPCRLCYLRAFPFMILF